MDKDALYCNITDESQIDGDVLQNIQHLRISLKSAYEKEMISTYNDILSLCGNLKTLNINDRYIFDGEKLLIYVYDNTSTYSKFYKEFITRLLFLAEIENKDVFVYTNRSLYFANSFGSIQHRNIKPLPNSKVGDLCVFMLLDYLYVFGHEQIPNFSFCESRNYRHTTETQNKQYFDMRIINDRVSNDPCKFHEYYIKTYPNIDKFKCGIISKFVEISQHRYKDEIISLLNPYGKLMSSDLHMYKKAWKQLGMSSSVSDVMIYRYNAIVMDLLPTLTRYVPMTHRIYGVANIENNYGDVLEYIQDNSFLDFEYAKLTHTYFTRKSLSFYKIHDDEKHKYLEMLQNYGV